MQARSPSVIALDVNETLSDMRPLAAELERLGAPRHFLGTWFASVLRDGLALTLAGGYADFIDVARAVLRSLLATVDSLKEEPERATDLVLSVMRELPLHPDVRPGLERLRASGIRLVTLTNGSVENARGLLERGGVSGVERCISVEEVRHWKPAPQSYKHAVNQCGVAPHEMMLVAVHPWDIDGAKRAGLHGAWINRDRVPYPEPFWRPDFVCRDFQALADELT
jgi:2-haloacid dehalogenase